MARWIALVIVLGISIGITAQETRIRQGRLGLQPLDHSACRSACRGI